MLIGQLIFTYTVALPVPAEGEFFGLFEMYRMKTLQVLHFVLSFCTLLSNAHNGNFFFWHSLLACLHEIATSRVSFRPGLASFFVHVNFLS